MSVYLEAMLLLFPPDAGGRRAAVAPREGSYRPFARLGTRTTRARVIEGPPLLEPGDEARVMLELETDALPLRTGVELQILETGEQLVGLATILRVCRDAVAV